MKHYCPYCNSEQEYYIDKRIFKEYKGVDVNVEENVPICKKCKNARHGAAEERLCSCTCRCRRQ